MPGARKNRTSFFLITLTVIINVCCQGNDLALEDLTIQCLNPDVMSSGNIRLQAVSHCGNSIDTDKESKCTRDLNMVNGRTSDLIPVTDTTTDIIYKNINCANCNGVNIYNTTPWFHEIICTSMEKLNIQNVDNLLNVVFKSKSCSFHLISPGSNMEGSMCYFVADSCNVTNALRSNSVVTNKTQCKRDNFSAIGKGIFFYNKKCAACNGIDESYIQLAKGGGSDQITAWSFLLSFNDIPEQPGQESYTCSSGRIYDRFNDRCLDASCSFLRTIKDNECAKVIHAVDASVYKLGFRLFPLSALELQVAIESVSYLKDDLINILVVVFTHVPFIEYEILFFPALANEDWGDVSKVKQSAVIFVEWRFKIKVEITHDPEAKLKQLLSVVDDKHIHLNVNNRNTVFSIVVHDFRESAVNPSMWKQRCSPVILKDDSISLCRAFYLQYALQTNEAHDTTFVRYFIDKRKGNNTYKYIYGGDSLPRSILEYKPCPFIEVHKKKNNWEDIDKGIKFLHVNMSLPFTQFVYGPSADGISVCLDTYLKLNIFLNSACTSSGLTPWMFFLTMYSLIQIL